MMDVKYDENAKTLTIVVACQEPAPSASGKTLVVASSHGNKVTDCRVNDKPLIVGLNAYIGR